MSTSSTPATRSASLVSMRAMRPLGMVDVDDAGMDEAAGLEFAGIFGLAGDLGAAVDARGGGTDVGRHGFARCKVWV